MIFDFVTSVYSQLLPISSSAVCVSGLFWSVMISASEITVTQLAWNAFCRQTQLSAFICWVHR